MLFRRRRAPLAPSNVPPNWASAGVWRDWEPPKDLTRGEVHYAQALAALAGRPRPGGWLLPVAAALVRDLHDRHDPNAIRVEVDGERVGHLAAVVARQLAPKMDRDGSGRFLVCAVIRGGSIEAPHLGVQLWLGRRPAEGPDVEIHGRLGDVPWPPGAGEGREPAPHAAPLRRLELASSGFAS
jgi:hypothetical protein